MQNEVDGRRDAGEHDPRYEDHEPQYEAHEPQVPQYAHDQGYDDDYQAYDDQGTYEEPAPARRSRIVPVLTIVAALLAVALGVVVVLYSMGFFEDGSESGAQVAAQDSAPIDLTPNTDTVPEVPAVREIDTAVPDPDQTLPPVDSPSADVRDATVAVAPAIQGDPPVRSTHGDWQIRCDTPAGAQGEQCVLMQFVTAEDRENVGLTVIILKTADGEARLMRILAPLGVLLPNGLSLKIDETDIGRAGFVRCLPNGCVAEVILEEPLLEQLGNGGTATFIIFQTPEEGIGIPISLAGFGTGFAALPSPLP